MESGFKGILRPSDKLIPGEFPRENARINGLLGLEVSDSSSWAIVPGTRELVVLMNMGADKLVAASALTSL